MLHGPVLFTSKEWSTLKEQKAMNEEDPKSLNRDLADKKGVVIL